MAGLVKMSEVTFEALPQFTLQVNDQPISIFGQLSAQTFLNLNSSKVTLRFK